MLRRHFFGKVHFDVKVLRLKERERERGNKFLSFFLSFSLSFFVVFLKQ